MKYEDFIKYAKRWGLNRHDLAQQLGVAVRVLYNYRDGKKLCGKSKKKLKAFYDTHIAPTIEESKPTITQTESLNKTEPVQGKFEKVSLLDEVAIIDSLNKGKTLISFNSGRRYKLVDGLIVTYSSNDTPLFISGAIDLSDRDGYYCLQPVPVKLKLSRKYVSVENKIGTVFAIDKDEYYVVFEGDKNLWKYDINGKCLDDNGSNLIMEVEQ